MIDIFFISLVALIYTYIVYPLFMFLMAQLYPKRWEKAPYPASVSAIMAVANAEHLVEHQLLRLTSLPASQVQQIIVVSDGSTDRTNCLLQKSDDRRLNLVLLSEHHGKASALNRGIAMATGEILFFVDVRPHFETQSVSHLIDNFADPSVGCVTGELELRHTTHDGAASAVSGLYWQYEQWIRMNEAAWDSPLGVYGGFYAARKSLVDEFPDGLLLDDMFQPLMITGKGYRCVIDKAARAVDIWPAEIRDEFLRKVRTLAGNFQLVAHSPWLLTPRNRLFLQLLSHKMGRLVAPYFLICTLITSTMLAFSGHLWLVLALLQWGFWILAATALRHRVPVVHRIASSASAFLVLNCAAVMALYRFLFTEGPLHKIWVSTPRSSPQLQEKG